MLLTDKYVDKIYGIITCSDRINPEGLHKVLDVFARRCSPVPESPGLGYTWTLQQIECATDIMFRKPEYLESLYNEIIRTAIFTVKPDDIATFLGQRITYNCSKEIRYELQPAHPRHEDQTPYG